MPEHFCISYLTTSEIVIKNEEPTFEAFCPFHAAKKWRWSSILPYYHHIVNGGSVNIPRGVTKIQLSFASKFSFIKIPLPFFIFLWLQKLLEQIKEAFPFEDIVITWKNSNLNRFIFQSYLTIFVKSQKSLYTRTVPKLVFILSRQACNAIYRNSDKAFVFCSAFPFQQAPVDNYVSIRYRVIAGFVKTVACTPPKKGKKKMYENRSIFIHIILPFQGYIFDILFLEIPSVCTKHASILSTLFFFK